METIQPSTTHPGRWQIGEHELVDGDVFEVQMGAEWREVRVEYYPLLREQRLFFEDKNLPIMAGARVRRLRPNRPDTAHGK
jgi:hypothetical protein